MEQTWQKPAEYVSPVLPIKKHKEAWGRRTYDTCAALAEGMQLLTTLPGLWVRAQ